MMHSAGNRRMVPDVPAVSGRPRGISVLIVDDHAVFADALQARLSSEPDLAPVAVAYSVVQARAYLDRQRADVALLDLVLGDGSGLDLAERMRQVAPETKVVILTAVESVESVVTALAIGARAWLPKTIDAEHLVRVIRGVHVGEAWLAPALLGKVLNDLVGRAVAPPDPLAGLTAREREVLQCMVDGLTRVEIAERLCLSVNTIRTHTQNLIAKLGAHSTLESVALALRNGLHISDA
jgi:DNA-binding NarL/FixJ family response regulator